MLDTQADLHSLCFVRAEKANGPYASCGVFISPRRILTTFHSVSGAKTLSFTAANGNTTTMKRRAEGGVHVFDKKLDLAVVELKLDTHSDWANINFNGSKDRSLFRGRRG